LRPNGSKESTSRNETTRARLIATNSILGSLGDLLRRRPQHIGHRWAWLPAPERHTFEPRRRRSVCPLGIERCVPDRRICNHSIQMHIGIPIRRRRIYGTPPTRPVSQPRGPQLSMGSARIVIFKLRSTAGTNREIQRRFREPVISANWTSVHLHFTYFEQFDLKYSKLVWPPYGSG
jgi:hypothetical protein